MNILLVVTHPRTDSLTFAVKDRFIEGLRSQPQTHEVDVLDLDRDGFSSVYSEEDERDWINPARMYAPDVRKEMDRVLAADAIVFVFPLWWYSVPGLMKTYLDRVWNMGLLGKVNAKRVLWICLAGGDKEHLMKYGYHDMITHYLNVAIAGYARLQESRVEFLYDTLSESTAYTAGLIERAYELGRDYR